jgi:acyl carrier protein
METAMPTADVEETVYSIVARLAKVDRATVTPASTLRDLGVSSLTALEVLFEIEEAFDFEFTDQNADFSAGTLQDLVDAVHATLAGRRTGAA